MTDRGRRGFGGGPNNPPCWRRVFATVPVVLYSGHIVCYDSCADLPAVVVSGPSGLQVAWSPLSPEDRQVAANFVTL